MPPAQNLTEQPEVSSRLLETKGKLKGSEMLGKPKPPRKIPVIDLSQGVPLEKDEEVKQWIRAETVAFEGREAWDEEAQLSVTEVAVSPLHSSILKIQRASGDTHRLSAIPAQTMGR